MRKALQLALLALTTALVALPAAPSTAAVDGTTPPEQPPITFQFEDTRPNAALDQHTVYVGERLTIRFLPDPATWPWTDYVWAYGDGRPQTRWATQICSTCPPAANGIYGFGTYKTPGAYTPQLDMRTPDGSSTAHWSLPTITVLPDTDTPVFKTDTAVARQKPGRVKISGYVDEHQSGVNNFEARAILRTTSGTWMAQRRDSGWVKAPSKAAAWRKASANDIYTTLNDVYAKKRPTTSDHARNVQTFAYAFPGKAAAGTVTVRLTGQDWSGTKAKQKTLTIRLR